MFCGISSVSQLADALLHHLAKLTCHRQLAMPHLARETMNRLDRVDSIELQNSLRPTEFVRAAVFVLSMKSSWPPTEDTLSPMDTPERLMWPRQRPLRASFQRPYMYDASLHDFVMLRLYTESCSGFLGILDHLTLLVTCSMIASRVTRRAWMTPAPAGSL